MRVTVQDSKSILGFECTGSEPNKVFDRFLTVEGKPAYHIGNICGTCSFFFERLDGANQSISAEEISDKLKEGLKTIDDSLIDQIKVILPNGEYVISLMEVLPRRVLPGSEGDYFIKEQIELWGIDGFWNLPHYPKTEYYRTRTVNLGQGRGLFEFIVPMFPGNWLNANELEAYKSSFRLGLKPTALALSVLDVKQPATSNGKLEIFEHWCLAHYLLDGHHKMFAASEVGESITMLSFLSLSESIAGEEDITGLIESFDKEL